MSLFGEHTAIVEAWARKATVNMNGGCNARRIPIGVAKTIAEAFLDPRRPLLQHFVATGDEEDRLGRPNLRCEVRALRDEYADSDDDVTRLAAAALYHFIEERLPFVKTTKEWTQLSASTPGEEFLPVLPEGIVTARDLHCACLSWESPLRGEHKRLRAVYQSLGGRSMDNVSIKSHESPYAYSSGSGEGMFLEARSDGGDFGDRAWSVSIELAIPDVRERDELRALTRGWDWVSVTVSTTSETGNGEYEYKFHHRNLPDPEMYPYQRKFKFPEELWGEAFAASAWETYLHDLLHDRLKPGPRL